jgi:hypothetical protein
MIRDVHPDPDLDFLPIPDSGVKKGTGSRIRNTAACHYALCVLE